MNTAQLTVLWYAALVIIAILFFEAVSNNSAYTLIVAIVVLTTLLIYTLKPHPQARKGTLLLLVVGPFIVFGTGFYGWRAFETYQENKTTSLIALDQIEITELSLERDSASGVDLDLFTDIYLIGALRNHSSYVLKQIILEFTPKLGLANSTKQTITVHTSPRQAEHFREQLHFYPSEDLPKQKLIPVEFKVIGTRGQVPDK